MKKIFTFFAVLALATTTMMAYTLNNPVGTDGRYIVKCDCKAGAFAASNDMEADETFVFAVDLTGTWLAEWLKGTPTNAGASRGVAINNWTNYGDTNGDFRRLKQINGNIWGTTCNFAQLMVNPTEAPKATMKDSVVYVYAQFFGFEYTNDNPGVGWWMWDGNDVAESKADGSDCLFAFAKYTGTKTSPELYADDYPDGDIYGFAIKGYAAPCVDSSSGIENADVQEKSVKFIENGQLYIMTNGVKYNALGVAVQ
jgi:hypothetical protein